MLVYLTPSDPIPLLAFNHNYGTFLYLDSDGILKSAFWVDYRNHWGADAPIAYL